MFCAIGGHVPAFPVVNRRTGTLYERALIENWIATNGPRDPATGDTLVKDDLISVHGGPAAQTPGNIRLRMTAGSSSSATDAAAPAAAGAGGSALAMAATSVPGLLGLLQSEWEALLLEQYSLRQQLAATQQELSLALYKHEAACRVIAKLVAERDAALQAAGMPVPAVPAGAGEAGTGATDAAVDSALPDSVCDELSAYADKVKAASKAPGYAGPAAPTRSDVGRLVEQANLKPPHTSGSAGVTCCAAVDLHGMRLVLTGSHEGRAFAMDALKGTAASVMTGHSGAVTRIWGALDLCVTSSADGTARLWRTAAGGAYQWRSTMRHGGGGINDFAVLPAGGTGRFLTTAGADGTLRFFDVHSGVCVSHGVVGEGGRTPLITASAHPTSLLVATGSGPAVHLWDVRDMVVDLTAPLQAGLGHVTATCFSSDQRTLAVGTSEGVVQLWDLRSLRGGAKAAPPVVLSGSSGRSPVSRLQFDNSGSYVAAAADVVSIWDTTRSQQQGGSDTEAPLLTFATHRASPSDVAWGAAAPGAVWLASCGAADEHVKVYSSGL